MQTFVRFGLFLVAIASLFFVSVVFQGCGDSSGDTYDDDTCAILSPIYSSNPDMTAISTQELFDYVTLETDKDGITLEDIYDIINSRVRAVEGFEDFHVDERDFFTTGFPVKDPHCGFDEDGNHIAINSTDCLPGFPYYASFTEPADEITEEDINFDEDGISMPEYIFESYWNKFCNLDGTDKEIIEERFSEDYEQLSKRSPRLGRHGNMNQRATFADSQASTVSYYRFTCERLRYNGRLLNCSSPADDDEEAECIRRQCPAEVPKAATVNQDSITADDGAVDVQEICNCGSLMSIPINLEAVCGSTLCPTMELGEYVEATIEADEDEDILIEQFEQIEEIIDKRSVDGVAVRGKKKKSKGDLVSSYCLKSSRRGSNRHGRQRIRRKIALRNARKGRRVSWKTKKGLC